MHTYNYGKEPQREIKGRGRPFNGMVQAVNQTHLKIMGIWQMTISLDNLHLAYEFLVTKGAFQEALIRTNFLRQCEIDFSFKRGLGIVKERQFAMTPDMGKQTCVRSPWRRICP
ncbi:aspartic peptidase, retroviral-like 1 [Chelydra serpentina]|uniref:Aspartic peptidase, retroviral-like 1 n=1 Tax=Chelydra serpentina TaxID=8475 RepID=A0A8T1SHF1_CHESE|nr:aspartic peptidase, retroviral-like 1 [Chelydra serpentina]